MGGGIFPYHSEYFSHAENLELLFCSTAFFDKIIRGNTSTVLYILSACGKYGGIFALQPFIMNIFLMLKIWNYFFVLLHLLTK